MVVSFLNYFFFSIDKKLKYGIQPHAGRNYQGVICVHHRRGPAKKKKISVDFFRRINNFCRVLKIIKNSNFTGYLAFVLYENGLLTYILKSAGVKIGDILYSGSIITSDKCKLPGSSITLKDVELFTLINNIELYPFQGSKLARSAGSSAILISKEGSIACIKLKSGWCLNIDTNCICTLGIMSNTNHNLFNFKKAGTAFLNGHRPHVRGVAMNPCDHPHGGGEGRKSPPVAHKSPWGWLTKGVASKKKKRFILKKKLMKKIK